MLNVKPAVEALLSDASMRVFADLAGSEYDVLRCTGVQGLGVLGDSAAADLLIAALEDEDEDVRIDAATALGRLKAPAAEQPLLAALRRDPSGDVKIAVLGALAALVSTEAVPILRKLVSGRAEDEMAWDDASFYDRGWDDWLDAQVAAIGALGALGDEAAVDGIVAALADESGQEICEQATKALARMGDTGLDALANIAVSGDERHRRSAVKAAGISAAPRAVSIMESALADAAASVRLVALETLAAADADNPASRVLLKDRDPIIRAAAVRLLSLDQNALVGLVADDIAPAVKIAALEKLCDGKRVAADHPLLRLFRLTAETYRGEVAAVALTTLVKRGGDAAIADVESVLTDSGAGTAERWAAIRSLGEFRDERAGDLAVQVVLGEDRPSRLEAMAVLAARFRQFGSEAALSALIESLNGTLAPSSPDDGKPEATQPAPAEMAESSDPNDEAVTALEDAGLLVSDSESSTLASILGGEKASRARAAEAEERDLLDRSHRRRGRTMVSPETGLYAADVDTRRFAAELLGEIAAPQTVDAVAVAMENETDETVLLAVLDAYRRLGGDFATLSPERIEALTVHPDPQLRARLLAGLAQSAPGEARAIAMRLMGDDDTRVRAAAAEILAADPDCETEAAAMLSDPSVLVRGAVLEGLAQRDGGTRIAVIRDSLLSHSDLRGAVLKRVTGHVDRDLLVDALGAVLDDGERRRDWRAAADILLELHA